MLQVNLTRLPSEVNPIVNTCLTGNSDLGITRLTREKKSLQRLSLDIEMG